MTTYRAIFTDKATGKQLYIMNQKKPLNKFFWEKDKLVQVDRLSKLNDLPKSQILIEDLATWPE